jgi:hypothetical protein
VQIARDSKMRSAHGVNFTAFLLCCIFAEFAIQWLLWLLPTSWRDEIFSESLLHFAFFLILAVVILASLARVIEEFKARSFYVLLPYAIFAVRTACFGLMFQVAYHSKFLLAQPLYAEAVQLVKNMTTGNATTIPIKFWYIGGAMEDQVEIWHDQNQKLVFFNEFKMERDYCGYLYDPSDNMPKNISYEINQVGTSYFVGSQRIVKNWFYGCVSSISP